MTNKKILIATGGTGGHTFPALSLAKSFLKSNYKVSITSDKRGLKYLKDCEGINLIKLSSSSINKKNIFVLIFSLFIIFFSVLKSIILLLFLRPKLIFGMGGYASFPICFASIILRIKFILYENNLVIGKTNRYLLPFAEKIFVSSSELEGVSEKNKKKIIEVGNILREEIINFDSSNKINFDKIKILVLGGSQSAKIFAEVLPQIFEKLRNDGIPIKIFQQCQINQTEQLSKFYKKIDIDYEIFNFTNKIVNYYSKVNLAITRSGSSVLSELVNTRTPFIAIPLPTAADDHQLKNAQYYEKKGFGYLVEEKSLSNKLYNLINSISKDKNKIKDIISNQSQYSDKDIFNKIKIIIEKILNEKN